MGWSDGERIERGVEEKGWKEEYGDEGEGRWLGQ